MEGARDPTLWSHAILASPSLQRHPCPHGPGWLPNSMSVISANRKGTVKGRAELIPCEGQAYGYVGEEL